MSEGHGDCGGHHAEAAKSGDINAAWDGNVKQPQPFELRLKLNGAPITELSHELVIKVDDAPNR